MVVVDIPLSLALRGLWGLPGLVIALALATFLVVIALMAAVSRRMLELTMLGLAKTALLVGAIAVVTFGIADVVANGAVAALLGLVLYAVALLTLRPRGLVAAFRYVRVLHD